MNKARHLMRIVGALLLGVTVAGAPALTYAQHGFGGGGGGGGHFSGGGGGHFAGGSGGHSMGGAHFGGGGRYFGGVMGGGGHYAAAGGHYAAAGHFAAPRAVHGNIRTVAPGVAGHPGYYGHPGTAYAPGTSYWHGGHPWYGGYWHGGYWPNVWFRPGYAWWLPVLPIGYATFWWSGVPYYYWNNIYYTWSPGYNGYVVTDPPPVATDIPDASADQYEQAPPAQYSDQAQPPGQYNDQPPPAQYNAAPPQAPSGSAGELFLYPRNGQSDAQQQNDRYECHSWAVGQTGFDPTRSGAQAGNEPTYRRAMIACLDARGYSAR